MTAAFELIRTHISAQALTWGQARVATHVSACTFEDCDITIACPATGLVLSDTVFRRCTLRVARTLKDFQFFSVGFEACAFLGRYFGCEFGFRQPSFGLRGYIVDSDFSQAELDLVAINTSSPSTLRFPPWPHLVLLDPSSTLERLSKAGSDPYWAFLASLAICEPTTAIVLRYRPFDGRQGFRTDPERLREDLRADPSVLVGVRSA